MSASDYPITLKYGAYGEAGYTQEHPHRGRDYGCPTGTPVVVAGQTIGLSGATGKVIGAHLHIQEWRGDYATTREPNNAFQGGTVTNVDLNGSQGDGSFGKFITIQTPDGWNDTYCHLSEINVQIGQKVGQVSTPVDVLRIIASEIEGFPMTETHRGDFDKILNDSWGWRPADDYVRHGWQVNPKHRGYLVNDITALTQQVADLTKSNGDLSAKNAELQKELDAVTGGDAIVITKNGWAAAFEFIQKWFGSHK